MFMSFLSSLSFLATILYLFVGIYAYKQNPKVRLHKAFLALCLSYSIWSFAYAFVYLAKTPEVFSFWNKIAAVGWCSFSAFTLFFILNMVDAKIIKNIFSVILLFMPAIFFFILAEFFFGPHINTPILLQNIFNLGDFIYNFIYLLLSMILLTVYGIKNHSRRIRLQVIILITCSLVPFSLNLFTQTIMPIIGMQQIPLMGQIYSLITMVGEYIVITRYKFLKVPKAYIFEEVMREMMDMTIIIDDNGNIIRVNKHTLKLVGYSEEEIINKSIDKLIDLSIVKQNCVDKKWIDKVKFNDAKLITKQKSEIPINVSCIPIFDKYVKEFMGVVLVLQDIRIIQQLRENNKVLQDKSHRDSLTKLFNHGHSMELLEKEFNKNNQIAIMMIDIDYFKKVNDAYGHQFGDEVLIEISKIISEVVGSLGHAGRYGGEEFIVILPNADIENAKALAEKIRLSIKEKVFKNGCKITVSGGLKLREKEDLVELVNNADKLLYRAKENGRDKVEYN